MAADKDKRVIITRAVFGICHMQVCAIDDATDEEILAAANRENPSGTTNGWGRVIRDDTENPKMNPTRCADDENRTHLLLVC